MRGGLWRIRRVEGWMRGREWWGWNLGCNVWDLDVHDTLLCQVDLLKFGHSAFLHHLEPPNLFLESIQCRGSLQRCEYQALDPGVSD